VAIWPTAPTARGATGEFEMLIGWLPTEYIENRKTETFRWAGCFHVGVLPRWVWNQQLRGSLVKHESSHLLQCRARGATLSPLVSTYPLLNTPVAVLRPNHGCFKSLPILTRIYPNVDAGIPPVSPQCAAKTARNWAQESRDSGPHGHRCESRA
jgi:hypothetical protein